MISSARIFCCCCLPLFLSLCHFLNFIGISNASETFSAQPPPTKTNAWAVTTAAAVIALAATIAVAVAAIATSKRNTQYHYLYMAE